jgi:hypothetical protein
MGTMVATPGSGFGPGAIVTTPASGVGSGSGALAEKRPRGRPPGSGKMQQLASLGERLHPYPCVFHDDDCLARFMLISISSV